MASFILFLLVLIGIAAVILYTNKGEKASAIKSILIEIFASLKQIFLNLKKLFLILKDLLPEQTDQDAKNVEATVVNSDSLESEVSSTTLKEDSNDQGEIQEESSVTVDNVINMEDKANSEAAVNESNEIDSDSKVDSEKSFKNDVQALGSDIKENPENNEDSHNNDRIN